jgi:protein-S-isoprenylcysteine O-methyltransferase Ste14
MSHRTADLPPLTGIAHVIRELRYHEAARQSLAVVLVLLYTVTAEPLPILAAIGLAVGLAGALVRLYASGFIVKNQELATDGAYRFVRHPLYTGNILLVTGFALAGSRWWGVPLALFFFWFYYPTAIEYEDRKLHRLFGAAWEAWSARTPALLPRVGGGTAATAGDRRWSLAVSNTHGELVFVAFALGCAAWIAWEAFFSAP